MRNIPVLNEINNVWLQTLVSWQMEAHFEGRRHKMEIFAHYCLREITEGFYFISISSQCCLWESTKMAFVMFMKTKWPVFMLMRVAYVHKNSVLMCTCFLWNAQTRVRSLVKPVLSVCVYANRNGQNRGSRTQTAVLLTLRKITSTQCSFVSPSAPV